MRSDADKPIDRLVRAAEPLLRQLLHFHWRFSRGLTLGVRAVVIDAAGRNRGADRYLDPRHVAVRAASKTRILPIS